MLKIVSGGQTGVDRGAIDAAIRCGAQCGGWCPQGRAAEDGEIPARYPVSELSGAGYRERTRQNVIDSDGTLIVYEQRLDGGTVLTAALCEQHRRPLLKLDTAKMPIVEAARRALVFIREHRIAVLNVAGPRASKWPQGQARAAQLVAAVLTEIGNEDGADGLGR